MHNPVFRYLIVLVFFVVAGLAVFKNGDYLEAGIWSCFAMAILVPNLLSGKQNNSGWHRYVSVGFMLLGIFLLILRVTGVIPVPVRPLP